MDCKYCGKRIVKHGPFSKNICFSCGELTDKYIFETLVFIRDYIMYDGDGDFNHAAMVCIKDEKSATRQALIDLVAAGVPEEIMMLCKGKMNEKFVEYCHANASDTAACFQITLKGKRDWLEVVRNTNNAYWEKEISQDKDLKRFCTNRE